jgi:hypothetical protein
LHSCKESGRATRCRPQGGLKNISAQAPRITWQGHQARTPQRGLHSRRKILGVQSRQAGLLEHNDLGRPHVQGAQLGWRSCIHTEVLHDLSIKARRPQAGRFGVQMTSIAANHPAEPLDQGIGDLSDRHIDHGGPMKIVDLLERF